PSSDRIDNSGLRVEISKDNGETWSTGPGVGGGIQPTIMFHPNGRLQMMARTGGAKSIAVTWSDDNGQSWSKPSASILPNNNSGLDAVTLRDGRQLLAYNHSYRGQAEMGHKGRGFLTVSVSKDGKAWEAALIVNYTTYRKNLFQFSYPAVIQSRNGLVHLVHTWGRVTINHAVINPASLKTVPMPDGKWPSKGHLSIEEWKKENPKYNQPETKM
ncbi:MAG: exo-alpha-sialidase, partial [Chitinispirillia bacterium]